SSPAAVASSSARAAEDCATAVPRLNRVLADALRGALPPSATLHNNLFTNGGNVVGGPGVSFSPGRSETGAASYVAFARIRDAGRVNTFSVDVITSATVRAGDRCAVDESTRRERQSKGVVVVECGQSTEPGGATIFRSIVAEPYGSGGYASVLVPHALVEIYRPGGELVRLTLSNAPEAAPPTSGPSGTPTVLPMML